MELWSATELLDERLAKLEAQGLEKRLNNEVNKRRALRGHLHHLVGGDCAESRREVTLTDRVVALEALALDGQKRLTRLEVSVLAAQAEGEDRNDLADYDAGQLLKELHGRGFAVHELAGFTQEELQQEIWRRNAESLAEGC